MAVVRTTKYDLYDQIAFQLKREKNEKGEEKPKDFEVHVQKHFLPEDEAAKFRSLSGRSFSSFTNMSWETVKALIEDWAEEADKELEKILKQTEDVKDYRRIFGPGEDICGKIFPAVGKTVETKKFTLFFTVYRNVYCGKVDYKLSLKSVYPTK